MTSQKLITICRYPSIRDVINVFIDKTVFINEDSKQVALKDLVSKEIREILQLNFITTIKGIDSFKPLNSGNISKEAKHYTGDFLPSTYLPTNDTQLFAGAIICALGLIWSQLQMNEIALRPHHPNYPYNYIRYLAQKKYDSDHYWLADVNKGIRSIDWGSPEQNKAFIQLME